MTDRDGQQFGNYHLIRLLGQGNFAEVYLGEHVYLKTQAAIKVLQTQLVSDEMATFLSGASAIALLKHPNIVRVLEFGVEDSIPFLATSYAPNGSLRQHYPKGTQLQLENIVSYVKQIAVALQYAHDRELLHRDIKPENILLGRHNELLLSDFGTVLITESLRYQSDQSLIGSVPYMAPEHLQGKACPASDQYALGIVVYEWLSGDYPFHGSFAEITDQHRSTPPPSLHEKIPAISSEVEEVVLKSLAKDPQQRFTNVKAFAYALEQASMTDLPTLEVRPSNSLPPSARYRTKVDQIPRSSAEGALQHTPQTDARQRLQKGHRLSAGLIALLIALVLLIGGGVIYYATVFYPAALHTQATVTAQTILTAQAQATARTRAQADATFTAMNPQDIYIHATSGNPVINDSLSNQINSTWKSESHPMGSCTFNGGAYHVSVPVKDYVDCLSVGNSFRNFAFQVQMKIIQGDLGGIIFRADSGNTKFYWFGIGKVSTGPTYVIARNENRVTVTAAVGSSPIIKTLLNQTYLITVVAHGSDFYVYVNKQYVDHLSDTTLSEGTVGVFATNQTSPSTEVMFSDAQVWIL